MTTILMFLSCTLKQLKAARPVFILFFLMESLHSYKNKLCSLIGTCFEVLVVTKAQTCNKQVQK